MDCRWKEEVAYRFAEGSLDPQTRRDFVGHLQGCEVCKERVAEAQRLDGLLRAGVTPVPAPVTLASKVASAVAAGRERPAPYRLRIFGWSLSPAPVALALVLALSLAFYAVAPGTVTAIVHKVLVFIPGLGIRPADGGALVATAPVTVQAGALTFNMEALFSDGQETTVKFTLSGLPGGKEGWEGETNHEHQPFLRTEADDRYPLTTSFHGVGGSPEGNEITGEMHFPPLPAGLRSVTLLVPPDFLVPAAVLQKPIEEIIVHIPLAPAEDSDLPSATPQEAAATVQGITLQVAASNVEEGRTVVLLTGQAEEGRISALGRMGGNIAELATLSDGRGNSYPLLPQGADVTLVTESFSKDLYFPPLNADTGTVTLRVPALQIRLEAEATVTIPLEGREAGETFEVNQTLDLGGYSVKLESARLDHDAPRQGQGPLWLYVNVDLGPTVDGRTLASFQPQRLSGSSAMASMGERGGEQMDYFGIPVEPGDQEVTIRLSNPIVVVEGPWEITFPLSGN